MEEFENEIETNVLKKNENLSIMNRLFFSFVFNFLISFLFVYLNNGSFFLLG